MSDSADDVDVDYEVARDVRFAHIVSTGRVVASGDADWTVSVDVDGLQAGSTYWYRFRAGSAVSPTGRTRTAPSPGAQSLRIGLVSCASYAAGFFSGYGHLADRNVDVVMHVGDYFYEGSPKVARRVRQHDPPGVVSDLNGYRGRFAQYRTDADLQRLHRRHPMIAVWDDHEFATNAWRTGATWHDPDIHGAWEDRVTAAARAYREWMPVRWPDPKDPLRLFRRLPWGDLADLVMVDTRLYGREAPKAGDTGTVALVRDRERSLLGDTQREWLRAQLRQSTARWRVIGNQVMLAPLRVLQLPRWLHRHEERLGLLAGGALVNPGQWDGFPTERRSLFEMLRKDGIDNVVVLTGDLHSSWVCELTLGPADRQTPVGVEFVTPSITSDSFADMVIPSLPRGVPVVEALIRRVNRHVRWVDTRQHGYAVVDVTPDRVQTDFWHVERIDVPDAPQRWAGGWTVQAGTAELRPAPAPAVD